MMDQLHDDGDGNGDIRVFLRDLPDICVAAVSFYFAYSHCGIINIYMYRPNMGSRLDHMFAPKSVFGKEEGGGGGRNDVFFPHRRKVK